AYSREAREPISGAGGDYRSYRRADQQVEVCIKHYEHDGSHEDLPADEIKMSYSDYVKNVLGFRDDERVWFANSDVDGFGREWFVQWDKGTSVEKIADADRACGGEGFTEYGSFYCVNPIKPDGPRKAENVSRYLYTMIESDDLPREEQLAIFRKSGI